MKIANKKGIALISVLIIAGVLASLITYTLKMLNTQNKAIKNTEVTSELVILKKKISTLLIDRNACAQTLSPLGDGTPMGALSYVVLLLK